MGTKKEGAEPEKKEAVEGVLERIGLVGEFAVLRNGDWVRIDEILEKFENQRVRVTIELVKEEP